jgi:hypothetical protein
MAGRTLTVYLAADTSKFKQGMSQAGDAADGPEGLRGRVNNLAGSLGNMLGPALVAGGLAAGAFAVKLGVEGVLAAGNLAEAINYTNVVFGDSGKAIQAWAQDANVNLTATEETALEAAASFAQFGQAAGLTGEELVPFSTGLVELAADMSSLKDVPLQQALDAIASSLRGEQEPIRAFNVLIDDAALKAEWFRMTGEAVTGTLTQQQKVLASHSLILAGTTAAQGDLERSQGSLNTTIKTLGVSVDDLKTQFGVGLLGAVQGTDLAMGGEGLTTTIQDLKEPVKELGGMVGDFAVNVGEVATMGKDAADSLNSFADSMGPVGDAAQEVAGILSGGMLNVILKINDAAVNAASALRALVGVQDSVAARASGPGNLGPWANRVLQ